MSTYGWIKSQTNRAVSWLVNTASAHASEVRFAQDPRANQDLATPDSAAPKQGRLKGKARTEARKAKEAEALRSTREAPKPTSYSYQVSTDELLRLARHLRDLQETFIMPKYVWRAYKDAIRGRQKYANKFTAEEPEHEGNEGHVYFLEILRQIISILQGCVLVQTMAGMPDLSHQDQGTKAVENLFMQLSIDPVDDMIEEGDDSNVDTMEDITSTSASPARYEPKLNPTEDNKLLWFCFLDDAADLQDFTVRLWQSYLEGGDGAPGLPVVTFLTEAAMAQIVMLEETTNIQVTSERGLTMKTLHDHPEWLPATMTTLSLKRAISKDPTYPISVPHSLPRMSEQLGSLMNRFPKSFELVAKDHFLIQYLMDLCLQESGSSIAFGSSANHGTSTLPANRLDGISQLLISAAYEPPSIAGYCAASALQDIWGSEKHNSRKALDCLEEYGQSYLEYAKMLHEQMISIPTLAPMEELDVLMQFIRANPVQLDRYRHLRSISPNKDSKSALCGLHRNMWKDMTLSFRDQKMMMSYIEELPDHTPNVAAIREYAEKFIMPNEDANFLRASNPAMSGKLLLNALMRREETNLEFANKNFDWCWGSIHWGV